MSQFASDAQPLLIEFTSPPATSILLTPVLHDEDSAAMKSLRPAARVLVQGGPNGLLALAIDGPLAFLTSVFRRRSRRATPWPKLPSERSPCPGGRRHACAPTRGANQMPLVS